MQPVSLAKILFDVGSILLVFLIIQFIKFFAKPFNSGFYCHDYSVNLPYKDSTVSNILLGFIVLLFPILFICITESLVFFHRKSKDKITRNSAASAAVSTNSSSSSSSSASSSSSSFDNSNRFQLLIGKRAIDVNDKLANIYINCGLFLFGLFSTGILTDLIKITVGRLRPNFLDVCKPDVDPYKKLCSLGEKYYLEPNIDFKCTSSETLKVEDSRMSFPSGHSSLAFYSMIYLILYTKNRWKCRTMGFTSKLVQLILLMIATFTALSRIRDNKHHPTDVLCGTIIGILFAVIAYNYLLDHLKPKTHNGGGNNNYQKLKKESTNYVMDAGDLETGNLISRGDNSPTSSNQNKFELTTNMKRGSSNQLKDNLNSSITMQSEII